MKILLLGSLIAQSSMEKLNSMGRNKASVAPVNYETMLAKGLAENGVIIEALSVPAVSTYPGNIYKKISAKTEETEDGIKVQWVPFLNIQGLKQLSVRKNVTRLLEKWLSENKEVEDKVVLMYSVYPPYTEPAIKLCKKYNCHLSAVIADLPEYMYSWKNMHGIRGWYSDRLSKKMADIQDKCDSYILFTKTMAKRMKIEKKPFMVSEGFCDVSIFSDIKSTKKYARKTVLYGGNLSRLYGIKTLVKAFMKTDLDAELHLYGAGADSSFIEESERSDSRIKYFGRVDRKTLLQAIEKAHLLVVNKPTADDYSKYSFSSKIPEYMASGTPLLTTKVGGMPEEYYPYVYFIEDESEEGIADAIKNCLFRELTELDKKGQAAREFMIKYKNYAVMTKEIAEFLKTQTGVGNENSTN